MSDTTFEAPTVEAALEKAATALGVAAGELKHEVVEKKQDFWGMGDDTVVIKAWTSQPEPPAEAPEEAPEEAAEEPEVKADAPEEPAEEAAAEAETPEPEQESAEVAAEDEAEVEAGAAPAEEEQEEPRADEDSRDESAADKAPGASAAAETDIEPADISALLEQIFHDMEFECTVEVAPETDGFLATVSGADKEALLEGNGRCLSALELIANNAFRNRMDRGTKIRVDAGDFRSRREQELADVAYQVAHSAKQTGRTQETQPLNPYERRLVHLALAEDPAVTTRSRGSGFLKNVQVIPQSGGRGRGSNRGRRR